MTLPAVPARCADFRTDVALTPPAGSAPGTSGCTCALHSRRRWAAALAGATLLPRPGWTQEGVTVGRQSKFTQLVSADQVEQAATQEYGQMKREAAAKDALAPDSNAQVIRLRAIAQRIIPFADNWNPRAKSWRWEVNLFGSKELNAFCMPGGKIAFYFGILQRLQLSDDEVAMIMGHEMAHALREHARERMGKTAATRIGASLISSLFGLGNIGDAALNMGGQLLTLKFSRDDESEADLVGLDLAARAGYDPSAAVSLWRKMIEANKGAPPEFLSTHPSGPSRIQDIQAVLPRVMPLYERAAKPPRRFSPPSQGNARRN
jgi:predicted Zn-dependent protease